MSKAAVPFWCVGAVIHQFVDAGCELRVAEATVTLTDGDCLNVRYLVHAATKRYVPLVDLEDDQFISETELAFWERRLGIFIARPIVN